MEFILERESTSSLAQNRHETSSMCNYSRLQDLGFMNEY